MCLALLTPLAWANVDQALLKKAEGLIKTNQFDEAYALLEPWEVAGAGDQVYDYLLGTAAMESYRPSKASFVYERILAVAPGYIDVRADTSGVHLTSDTARRQPDWHAARVGAQNHPCTSRLWQQGAGGRSDQWIGTGNWCRADGQQKDIQLHAVIGHGNRQLNGADLESAVLRPDAKPATGADTGAAGAAPGSYQRLLVGSANVANGNQVTAVYWQDLHPVEAD